MNEIDELQQRITVALDRIARGVGRMSDGRAGQQAAGGDSQAEVARLKSALQEEKTANAQLTERLKALKDRDGHTVQSLEARIEAMTRQLDVQGLEMQRMRKTTIQLRDQLRAVTEAAAGGSLDGPSINKALTAELEALRTARACEAAEIDEILSELTPLIQEAAEDA